MSSEAQTAGSTAAAPSATAPAATAPSGDADRRASVLDAALGTFARFGYRKTSMDEVARSARISRPGLYFLFSSKEALFRAAVERALENDLEAVAAALETPGRPVAERLLAAFDAWAGRYVGPLARDVAAVIDDNPELLGGFTTTASRRFEALVTDAVAAAAPGPAPVGDVVSTLLSTSLGIKHREQDRAAYVRRMKVAIALIVR